MAQGILHARRLRGLEVAGPDGLTIGRVADTWPLDGGGEPELLLVDVGRRFPRARFVPARRASIEEGRLRVPWTKLQLDDAPSAEDHRWGDPADLALAYWMVADDG